MSFYSKFETPRVHNPVFLFAFAGWADAAESATHALRYLVKRLDATKFAQVDPEDFYDFTQVRPHTGFDSEGTRKITWPSNELYYIDRNQETDIVILIGTEPSLKWRTFCENIVDTVHQLQVSQVLHVGALLDAVPHTRDTRITGTATSPELQDLLRGVEVRRSRYTGPTGISGVLMDMLRRENIPSVSLWGHAPHYLQVAPNPKVSLRLLEAVERLLSVDINVEQLFAQGENFERRVEQALNNEPSVLDYIQRLESQWDIRVGADSGNRYSNNSNNDDMPDPKEAVEAFEEFLRQNARGGKNNDDTNDV